MMKGSSALLSRLYWERTNFYQLSPSPPPPIHPLTRSTSLDARCPVGIDSEQQRPGSLLSFGGLQEGRLFPVQCRLALSLSFLHAATVEAASGQSWLLVTAARSSPGLRAALLGDQARRTTGDLSSPRSPWTTSEGSGTCSASELCYLLHRSRCCRLKRRGREKFAVVWLAPLLRASFLPVRARTTLGAPKRACIGSVHNAARLLGGFQPSLRARPRG